MTKNNNHNSQPAPALEHISKETAAALDQHEKNIRNYLKGKRKGAAQHFAYAFLVGRECLAAKETIGHGNSHDPNSGLKNFITARFPDEPYPTITFWMQYAKAMSDKAAALPEFKKTPLLLGQGKKQFSVKQLALIIDLVPRVMDGKSMTRFMRESRLLRDAEKPKHHPRKSVDPDKAAAAKKKQAESFFKSVLADLQLAEDHLKHLETVTLQSTLDHLVDVSNHIRELLKTRKGKA